MEADKNNFLSGTGGSPEEGESLFSALRPRPVPVPVPPPPPPAPPIAPQAQNSAFSPSGKAAVHETPAQAASPSAAEVREENPAPKNPSGATQDREILDYLKQKISEMERKLLESQEKGLAFAYEARGREEARKESRREMEEFLAEVKKQQAASDSERSRGLELEKARARIEALELKIMEFSAPKQEQAQSLRPALSSADLEKLRIGLKSEVMAGFQLLAAELAEKIRKETLEPLGVRLTCEISKAAEEMQKLRLELKHELAADFERLGKGLAEKNLKDIVEQLGRKLDAEGVMREKDKHELRLLTNAIIEKSLSLETVVLKRLTLMEALFSGFSSQLKAVEEEAAKRGEEFRAMAGFSFEKSSKMEAAIGAAFGKMASAMTEFGAGTPRTGAAGPAQEIKRNPPPPRGNSQL